VGRGGAGRGDGVVDALDLEGRGEAGGDGAAHGAGDPVGAHAPQPLLAHHVGGLHLVGARGATGAGDEAGTLAGDLLRGKAGILDGLRHGDIGVGRGIAHEATQLAVDQGVEVDIDDAGDLAAEAALGVLLLEANAGAPVPERLDDGFPVVAQAGYDAQASDYHSSHGSLLIRNSQWR